MRPVHLLYYYHPLLRTAIILRKVLMIRKDSDRRKKQDADRRRKRDPDLRKKQDADRRKLQLYFRLLLTIVLVGVAIRRLQRRPWRESITPAPTQPQPGEKLTLAVSPASGPNMLLMKTPDPEMPADAEILAAGIPAAETLALNATDEDSPVLAAPAALAAASQDDMTLIEGIGPKVAALLSGAGITTFQQLANADGEQLEEVLRVAGLRMINPSTWPEQARLAAQGDEEGLRALQGQLKSGRRA